jgi:hypothetical protein
VIYEYIHNLDTIAIHVDSWQYFALSWKNHDWFGFFYYENNLVVVRKSNITSLFFQETSNIERLYYAKPDYLYERKDIPIDEMMSLKYYYVNNRFIRGEYSLLCLEASPYYHTIGRFGETWEDIAKWYGITVDTLKALNKIKNKDTPKAGKVIRVY